MRRVLLVGCLLLAAGCGVFRGKGGPPPEDRIVLEVQNQNFYDANLFAVDGGERRRLGMVAGQGRQTFTFRWPRPDLRIEIHLVGAGRSHTESLMVAPGDIVELVIEPDLHRKLDGRRPIGGRIFF